MWKSKHNVNITYTPLEATIDKETGKKANRLDDFVNFEEEGVVRHEKEKDVHGVSTASDDSHWAWDWRGKGLLKVASSHWEVLAFGDEPDGNQWIVTHFTKTLFTPAGLDIYSRKREGPNENILQGTKDALKKMEDSTLQQMAEEVFRVEQK